MLWAPDLNILSCFCNTYQLPVECNAHTIQVKSSITVATTVFLLFFLCQPASKNTGLSSGMRMVDNFWTITGFMYGCQNVFVPDHEHSDPPDHKFNSDGVI